MNVQVLCGTLSLIAAENLFCTVNNALLIGAYLCTGDQQ